MLIEMIQTLRQGNFGVDILAITRYYLNTNRWRILGKLSRSYYAYWWRIIGKLCWKKSKPRLQSLLDQTPEIAHVIEEEEFSRLSH